MNLKEKMIRGGAAKLCSQGAIFVLRIGSLMVFARILDPKDFGLVGMVTAVIGMLNLFKDFGLSTVTVQRSHVTEEQISTLFWINLLVGSVLTLISVVLAPALASFYREPRLLSVAFVLATGFVINAAGVQHSALLQREMRFAALAVIETVSLLAGVIVGIVMAVAGLRYWSLVGMSLANTLVSTGCMWFATSWVPGRPRRQAGIRSMLRFGGTVTLTGLLVYIAYNFEKVLLGRFWGAEAVGIYGRAYQLVSVPTDGLNSAVGGVAFAALSRVQDDPVRFRNYFTKGYSLVLAITVPLTIASALFADDVVHVFLGAKWAAAATIFRLLAPTILIFALINPLGWVIWSLGLVARSLRVALVLAPVVIAGYVIGLRHGPTGVALGYSAAMALWMIPHILWAIHRTPIRARDVWQAIRRPLFSSVVAAAMTFATRFIYYSALKPLPRLFVETSILISVYLVMLVYATGQKSFYLDIVRTMRGYSSQKEEPVLST
jgi:O-antigen/teichoic acid export membrane protein